MTTSSFSATLPERHPTQILAVVEEKAGRVDFYNAKTNALLGGSKVGSFPHEIAISSDNKLAFVSNFGLHDFDQTTGSAGNSISVIDLETYQEIKTLITGYKNAPHGLKVRPEHPDELYVNTEVDNKIIVFDLVSNQIKKSFPAISGTHNIIFSPDGELLWLMSANNGVTKLSAETGAILGQYKSNSPIRGLSYTPDNNALILSGKDKIELLNPASMQVTQTIGHLGVDQILYSVMTPDNKYILAPAVWNNEVLVIDSKNHNVVKRLVTGLNPVSITFSPDSRFAFVTNGRSSHISRIDLQTLELSEINAKPGTNGIALFSKMINDSTRQQKKIDTLSIGSLLPLSGEKMSLGTNLMLGYEFIRDYINQHGGVKIGEKYYHLIIHYTDTQSDENHLIKLAKELNDEYRTIGLLDYITKGMLPPAELKDLNIIPFFSKLTQYDKVESFLFGDFQNLEALEKYFSQSLDLEMTEESLRAYFTLSFLKHSLDKNMYLANNPQNKPGIVLLHSSSGVKAWDDDWAGILRDRGYNVFVVDSFTPRGYFDRKTIGWENAYQAQLDDLNYAYHLLVNISGADKSRIGLIGYSLGGYSALRAMELDNLGRKKIDVPFKLAASFYGHAQRFNQTEFSGKIALFWGDDDDRAPLQGALALLQNSTPSNIELFHYTGAKHGFDNAYFPESIEITDEEGNIYHLGYNAVAHHQSVNDLVNFLYKL
jgi:DNA-binding beta-propeller fold protein YncE/dienelactone hydrolase